MRKVGVVTFTTGFNYGNRLQNYAVQEILKSFGFDVETIRDDIGKHNKIKRNIKKIVTQIYSKCPNLSVKNI